MKQKWSDYEIELMLRNYQFLGSTNIANILNRTKSSVNMMANRLSLKLNKTSKTIHLSNIKKKNIDEYRIKNNFNLINPSHCYYLGFLWSDGYLDVKRNTFGIDAIKKDMLELYEIIKNMGDWSVYYRTRINWKPQMNIRTTNPHLMKFLMKYDFHMKSKVSPNKLLCDMPEDNHKYFILGIIDGDGCIYYNRKQYLSQLVITSTHEQDWTYVEKFLFKRDIKYSVRRNIDKNGNKSSAIRITNKKDVLKLCDELYHNFKENNIGLRRKYDKYINIKQYL